jgi:exopolysaccharide production protein ExoZ
MSKVPERRQTFVGIQYARGVAALLVVFFHAAAEMAADSAYGGMPHPALNFGYVGVPIFFVISGFIITVVSLDSTLRPRVGLASFAIKRAVRILPFMWLAIVAYNLLSFVGTRSVEWGPLLRALMLWPAGTVKPNVIWTLRHEALFYLLFAASFLGTRRRPWLLALWCLLPVALYLLLPAAPGETGDPSFVQLFAADVNIMFGLGVLIGLYTQVASQRVGSTWPGGAMIVYAGGGLVATAAWLLGWRAGLGAYTGVAMLSALLIGAAVRLSPGTTLVDRLALLLGDASYAIYLVHNMVLLPGLLIGRSLVAKTGLWPVYSMVVIAAICVGIVVHLVVEKPLIAAISRRLLFRPNGRSGNT